MLFIYYIYYTSLYIIIFYDIFSKIVDIYIIYAVSIIYSNICIYNNIIFVYIFAKYNILSTLYLICLYTIIYLI